MHQSKLKLKKPLLLLATTMLLTVSLIIYFFNIGWELYIKEKNSLAIHASINKLSDRILYLDEVLTMSARSYILTGEIQWKDRYNIYEPELKIAIDKATALSSKTNLQRFISETKDSNDVLVSLERNAFLEVSRGNPQNAKSILLSSDYAKYKKIYSNGISRFLEGAKLETKEKVLKYKQTFRYYSQILIVSLLVIWVSVLLLFWKYFKQKMIAEKMLIESEDRLRVLAGLSYDISWQWDIINGEHKWFGDIDTTLGYEQNEFPRTIEAFEEIIHPDDRKRVMDNLSKHHKEHVKWHEIYRIIRKDGVVRLWDDRGETVWDKDGIPLVMTGAIMDITELDQSRSEMESISKELTQLIDTANAPIFGVDTNGNVNEWNQKVEQITGFTKDEVMGHNLVETRITEEFKESVQEVLNEALKGNETSNYEVPLFTKGGERVVVLLNATTRRNPQGQIVGVVGVGQDITEKKNAEKELEVYRNHLEELVASRTSKLKESEITLKKSREELRSLHNKLQSAVENEKIKISREIHDDLGQTLTAIKLDLSWLEKRIRTGFSEPSVHEKFKSIKLLLNDSFETIRKVSTELRPQALDVMGFPEAIKFQSEKFSENTNVKCKLNIQPDKTQLHPDLSTDLFRILQEGLTNISRHAQASNVKIEFFENGSDYILSIQDDGIGIDNLKVSDSGSLGLLGIRERVLQWNGQFKVDALTDKGTLLNVTIPKSNNNK
ncbi:MAG: PAS domain S-box protein [Nitrospinae bacterium]|nr:PAS domain S-box protein [Nitrospinota bacterium]